MKIKSIAAICKKQKRIMLFNKYSESGEVIEPESKEENP